jgi:tRNA nucleotidyltransferase (CCA-adding enzyme)
MSLLSNLAVHRPAWSDALLELGQHLRPGRTFVVGGCVRDLLRGVAPHDVDVEVFGLTAEELEARLEARYPHRVFPVGRAFGVLKVKLYEELEVDVALPRRESKIGSGHVGFEIQSDPTLSFEEAARRRDFTCNAISLDLGSGELIDPFRGAADIEKKILRATDPIHFIEDPLRVYRALQFVARFEFAAAPETQDLLARMVAEGAHDELPPERITEEFRKLFLLAERPSVGLQLASDIGLLLRSYPELADLARTPQEPEWHPEGDVWTHTKMVLDAAAALIRRQDLDDETKLQVMLGALCHDLGKPSTTQHVEGRIRSHGHEAAGEAPTHAFFSKLSFSQLTERAVVGMVREHLKPALLFRSLQDGSLDEKKYANAVRKLLKRIAPASAQALLLVAEADFRGRGFPEIATEQHAAGTAMEGAISRYALEAAARTPLVGGRELAEIGISPGPEMGTWIARVESERDEGRLETTEQALHWIKQQRNS